jgi:hypothetical protein
MGGHIEFVGIKIADFGMTARIMVKYIFEESRILCYTIPFIQNSYSQEFMTISAFILFSLSHTQLLPLSSSILDH